MPTPPASPSTGTPSTPERGAHRVDLPTYAFQHERYWLDARPAEAPATGGHPLLTDRVHVAGEDKWLFTGRVSLATHPWVADHVLLGTIVVPGTAFVEMVMWAGAEVGCPVLDELTLESPLVFEGPEVVRVQVTVDEPDADGVRAFAVYTRPDGPDDDSGPWARHAAGVVAPAEAATGDGEAALAELAAEAWPPLGGEPLGVDDVYAHLEGVGYDYGPSFTGIRAAWRRDGMLFAEVSLEGEHGDEAARFGLHPALFDAVVHGGALVSTDGEGSGRMLFSWGGVRRHRSGTRSLRVRVSAARESAWTIAAVDEFGAPVVSVDALAYRPVELDQLMLGRRSGPTRCTGSSGTMPPSPAPTAGPTPSPCSATWPSTASTATPT